MKTITISVLREDMGMELIGIIRITCPVSRAMFRATGVVYIVSYNGCRREGVEGCIPIPYEASLWIIRYDNSNNRGNFPLITFTMEVPE